LLGSPAGDPGGLRRDLDNRLPPQDRVVTVVFTGMDSTAKHPYLASRTAASWPGPIPSPMKRIAFRATSYSAAEHAAHAPMSVSRPRVPAPHEGMSVSAASSAIAAGTEIGGLLRTAFDLPCSACVSDLHVRSVSSLRHNRSEVLADRLSLRACRVGSSLNPR